MMLTLDVNELLKAIYETLQVKEDKVQLSEHDLMYEGLQGKKSRVLPVHKYD